MRETSRKLTVAVVTVERRVGEPSLMLDVFRIPQDRLRYDPAEGVTVDWTRRRRAKPPRPTASPAAIR